MLTIPTAIGSLLLLPLFAAVMPLFVLIDLGSQRTTFARAVLFFSLYIVNQNIGILCCLLIWMEYRIRRQPKIFEDRNHRLQHWWANSLLSGLQRLFEFSVDIDGDVPDCGGSYLYVRHVSSADTLLPLLTVVIPQQLRCHYVLKQELCLDPCLDIVAHRIPNAVIQRGKAEEAIHKILSLTEALTDRSCIVFYPEGTRFSNKKRRYVLDQMEEGSDQRAFAESLACTLPPKKRGSLGLMVQRPSTPVVFVAHVGFEKAGTIGNLINGGLFRQRVQCAFWKVNPPSDVKMHGAWLEQHWLQMDQWLQERSR